jgi:hypothetical protein
MATAANMPEIPEMSEPHCPLCDAEMLWRSCDNCMGQCWVMTIEEDGWEEIESCPECSGNGGVYRCLNCATVPREADHDGGAGAVAHA